MVDAMPDQGKSVLCTHFAACASQGKNMPDGTPCVQGAVILVNIEDDASDTVKPRLLAAGANVEQVIDLSIIHYRDEQGQIAERSFMIPRDLPLLEEQIIKRGVVLVCMDPLMAILESHIQSKNDQDVRQALTPLARLLERTASTTSTCHR
jgi:RecA-family ATPase